MGTERDLPASVVEASPSEGLMDGGARAPFAADGNEGVDMQQEPTLAHCADVEEPSRLARVSVIANIRVQGGQLRQFQEEFDASITAADVQHRLAGHLKVKPDNVELMVCGKELLGTISLAGYPRDSEGRIALDAIATAASLPIATVASLDIATVASKSIDLQAPLGPTQKQSMVRR